MYELARKEVVVRLQAGHRTLCLLLQDDRPSGHSVTVAHIANVQTYEIARSQLAVDAEVEEGEFSQPPLHLQTHPNGPNLPQFEGRLLTDQLALVPRGVVLNDMRSFHGDLLLVEGDSTLRGSSMLSFIFVKQSVAPITGAERASCT